DENSKFFHEVINRRRSNLAIKGVMVDGVWVDDPSNVKNEFCLHFATRFQSPTSNRSKIDFLFPNRLCSDQSELLEVPTSSVEIRNAVWACGVNKSPGPDGFTFEFFRKFWDVIGPDFSLAVLWFFDHYSFAKGCNSSFIALIPKTIDPKFVSDYRPISLIGSLYKAVTKILATRLSAVINSLISEVQTAFLPNRQILDGPFIINELLAWCRHKKKNAMIFKVDFAKAYESIRWDFLDDILCSFGFGTKWRSWISGSLLSGRASVLVNGSPTSEFQCHQGLKQGDPLAPYLFLLVMESLHYSFSRVVDVGLFKGISFNESVTISHLFYADDAVFVGEWSDGNFSHIMQALHCFSLTSGLKINVHKSHLLGVGIPSDVVSAVASDLGCSNMSAPFKYLGVMVGGNMAKVNAWDDVICKLRTCLSKWKIKTLSIGGRLTLLKSVLGATPIYWMSLFKVPKSVLAKMEALRREFFNGAQSNEKKNTWVKWSKVLSTKKHGGLGVSSFFALNRDCLVAFKCNGEVDSSFRRPVRGGVEYQQFSQLCDMINTVSLSNMEDRWRWDLNGTGSFRVFDVRDLLDEFFLPKDDRVTRWVKCVPIKINIFAWKVSLDRLPTRLNLTRRGVQVSSITCPICTTVPENISYLLFGCSMASDIHRLICRWWDLIWTPAVSYTEWLSWFKDIRLDFMVKSVL
nr:putative RNA-directed DNA polymerase, eukaryota, reverse transcriptase zinc-binding domain protein [Tanacetum cinerariifolium]